MQTHLAVHITNVRVCLLSICWKKQIIKPSFQVNAKLYSVPGQTEDRRKTFLGWTSIDLSSKLSLTCGGNVNYYKSVHHPIPTPRNREHPGNFQKKSVRVFWTVQEGNIVRLPPRALGYRKRWKFEIILPLLCFLLDPLKNKHCRIWSSMINLWIDSRTCQKYPVVSKAKV